jgi:hypothetical protein
MPLVRGQRVKKMFLMLYYEKVAHGLECTWRYRLFIYVESLPARYGEGSPDELQGAVMAHYLYALYNPYNKGVVTVAAIRCAFSVRGHGMYSGR